MPLLRGGFISLYKSPFPMSQFKTICPNRYSVFTVLLLHFIYYSNISHSWFPLCNMIAFSFLQRLLFFPDLTIALFSFSETVAHLSLARPPDFLQCCKELIPPGLPPLSCLSSLSLSPSLELIFPSSTVESLLPRVLCLSLRMITNFSKANPQNVVSNFF